METTTTNQTNDVNVSSKSLSIFINQTLKFDLSKDEYCKIPNTIYEMFVQIIFHKDEKMDKFELDTVEPMDCEVIYDNKSLRYKHNDENSPYALFIKLHKNLGIDIDELMDKKFDNWVEESKENGYFDSLLNNLKNIL
jgi:hypothetical protein